MSDIPELAQVLVAEWAGPSAQVTHAEPLNKARARVYRLNISNAPFETVIIKIWQGGSAQTEANDPAAQFCCEQRAYRFLSKVAPGFATVPQLLVMTDDAFLITDAGISLKDTKIDYGPYSDQLAEAFAEFHALACKHLYDFEPPLPHHIGFKYDLKSTQDAVACGARFVLTRLELSCVRTQSRALEKAIARARHIIETPSPFRTLLHGDIGAARQLSFFGEKICLYDFEHARIDHALLDLAVPVLGKVEQDLVNGSLVWTGRNFDLSLYATYRNARKALDGFECSDAEWHENVGASLVYHVLGFIGELTHLPASHSLAMRFTDLISALLLGLSEHLESIRQFPQFYFFSQEFLAEHTAHDNLSRLIRR